MPVDDEPVGQNRDQPDRGRLDALDARIRAAREARRPKARSAGDMSSAALAWRMVTELVLGLVIGAGVGWGIDGVAGTMPLFLLIFGMLGFAAGVRTMMRSADEVRRRGAGAAGAQGAAGQGGPRADGNGADGADAQRVGRGDERGAAGAKDRGADGAKERS
jgi:ATP synthase protein I